MADTGAGQVTRDRAGQGSGREQNRGEDIDLDQAPITAVTVFRDGARVVRSGRRDAEAGMLQVVIGGLPASADPASVRVAVRGHHVALLDIEVSHRYVADPEREEVARLRSEPPRLAATRCRPSTTPTPPSRPRWASPATCPRRPPSALARAVSFGRIGHDELDQMAAHLSVEHRERARPAP